MRNTFATFFDEDSGQTHLSTHYRSTHASKAIGSAPAARGQIAASAKSDAVAANSEPAASPLAPAPRRDVAQPRSDAMAKPPRRRNGGRHADVVP